MEGATVELLEKREPQVVVGARGEAEVDVRRRGRVASGGCARRGGRAALRRCPGGGDRKGKQGGGDGSRGGGGVGELGAAHLSKVEARGERERRRDKVESVCVR